MSTIEVIEEKQKELQGLMEEVSQKKIETKPMNEQDRTDFLHVLKGMKQYKGDKKALRNFLIHTRNELRNANR